MPLEPGVYGLSQMFGDGIDLNYTLTIPEGYDPERPTPLVLALHYGWNGLEPPPFYGQGFLGILISPALSELGAILVAPDCPAQDWANPTSESVVMALLDFIQENYTIDEGKILITGYSLGGAGTWYIAARHQARFSAAIPMAGWPDRESLDLVQELPLYVIHSRQDQVVPIGETEQAVEVLKDRGVAVEFVVVTGIQHYETRSFGGPLREAIPWIKATWGEP
jgi:predicted peptidase